VRLWTPTIFRKVLLVINFYSKSTSMATLIPICPSYATPLFTNSVHRAAGQ
jgi:hypothetical protein